MRLILITVVMACCGLLAAPSAALGGGGGQNILLLVNQNDEASLRMAQAYAAARAVPDRNVVYLAAPTSQGFKTLGTSGTVFLSNYVAVLPNLIRQRGLEPQLDYIGVFGHPHSISHSYKAASGTWTSIKLSFFYSLGMMTQYEHGMPLQDSTYRTCEMFQTVVPYTSAGGNPAALPYTPGGNFAIHHANQIAIPNGVTKPPGYTYAQWYMTANLGYAGEYAIGPQQYIAAYARSVAADGTSPAGKVYYAKTNDELRSGTREPYWPSVQQYMTAHAIPWEQLDTASTGNSPKNKPDIRGAVIGAAGPVIPNGSTYLPGSYADIMTSNTATYGNNAHTKTDKLILAGAAGAAGNITEPYAIQDRFTLATLFVYHGDGSTLGEAFAKSVRRPDYQMFQGDPLSQAYADVPGVTLTNAPDDESTVAGPITIAAAASLTNPRIATGIANLQLFVDGLPRSAIAGAEGTFDLDTTTLSDGRHELRVVACNNSQAESQGYALRHVFVNNSGQSVTAIGTTFNVAWNEQLPVPVAATVGTGTVNRIELRALGRVVGQVAGAAGQVTVDARTLAFGANIIKPVAVFTGGAEVEGPPITVQRDFQRLTGFPVTPPAQRAAGFKYDYFTGGAGRNLAELNIDRAPDHTIQGTKLMITPASAVIADRNLPDEYLAGNNAGLAVRISTAFQVPAEGEYSFWFGVYYCQWESQQILIDGRPLTTVDLWNGAAFSSFDTGSDTSRSCYLMPGEHRLTILLSNYVADEDAKLQYSFAYRGPDGLVKVPDATTFYSAPEPPLPATIVPSRDWVYQNTLLTTADRHRIPLTVTVANDPWGNSSYTVAVTQSGPGLVTPTTSPDGLTAALPSLDWTFAGPVGTCYLVGGRRLNNLTNTGPCAVRVTVTGDVGGTMAADLPITVRPLGDLNGRGGVNGQDSLQMNKRLNGLLPDGIEYDLNGIGGAGGEDKLLLNKILNGLAIP